MKSVPNKEWRTKAILLHDHEEAIILAAKLIHCGFDFAYLDGDNGPSIRCLTKDGHRYASVVQRQK